MSSLLVIFTISYHTPDAQFVHYYLLVVVVSYLTYYLIVCPRSILY